MLKPSTTAYTGVYPVLFTALSVQQNGADRVYVQPIRLAEYNTPASFPGGELFNLDSREARTFDREVPLSFEIYRPGVPIKGIVS